MYDVSVVNIKYSDKYLLYYIFYVQQRTDLQAANSHFLKNTSGSSAYNNYEVDPPRTRKQYNAQQVTFKFSGYTVFAKLIFLSTSKLVLNHLSQKYTTAH